MRPGNFDTETPPCPLPNFRTLSFDESNRVGVESLARALDAQAGADLLVDFKTAEDLTRKKMREALRCGKASQETVGLEIQAWDKYTETKWKHLDDPQHAPLTEAMSRGDLSIQPYEIPGRNVLSHPYTGGSAGMKGLYPSYDDVYRAFMEKHRLLNHFPKRIAALGGVFVSPPDLSFDENMALLKDLRRSHLHFVDVPVVSRSSTRRELIQLLSHVDADIPAAVVDKGGALLGFVWRKGAEEDRKKEYQRIEEFYQSIGDPQAEGIESQSADIRPEEAYRSLREKGKQFLYRTDEHGVHQVMTKTTAALSTLLPPFEFKKGLGSVVYIGVNSPERSMRQLEEYVAFGVAGIILETAHADRDDVLKFLRRVRDRFPDLFIICGTATNPIGVREILQFADCVKVGIAEGSHCRTSQTGVGIPNAWAGIVCGAAAEGKGTVALDGWGSTREFVLGLSFHNVRMRIGGGAFAARAESSMPLIDQGGVLGKMFRGEASAPADHERSQRRNGHVKTLDEKALRREMGDRIYPYWEGEEMFNPLRDPPNIGAWMWLCKQRLLSAMSYAGVRKFDTTRPPLRQFHEESIVYVTPEIAA